MPTSLSRGAIGALTAATAFASLAGVAEAKTFSGTVVHRNARAHSFTVADHSGRLYAVHAPRTPRLGRRVRVTATSLRDGTFHLQRERTSGRAHVVRVRGVVSWRSRRTGRYTISAPGVSMLVVPAHRRSARATDATPPVGSDVVATGTVDDQGDLEEQTVSQDGQSTSGYSLEGTILAVDLTARTITVSGDDEDQSGSGIVVSVPSTFDITQYTTGEEVELLVQPTGAGTATLLGSADDQNAETADDQGDDQGDAAQGDDASQYTGSSGASETDGGDNSTESSDSSTSGNDSSSGSSSTSASGTDS